MNVEITNLDLKNTNTNTNFTPINNEDFKPIDRNKISNDLENEAKKPSVEIIEKKLNNKNNEDIDEEKEKIKKLLLYDVKPVSAMKLFYTFSNNCDIVMMILGTLGSMFSGVSMPIFSLIFGNTLSEFGPRASNVESIIGKMVVNFLGVGVGVFFSYILNIGFWMYVGRRQLHRMKEMYFELIMKQEQGWFDSSNPYEFSTKVQAQLRQVEGGLGEKVGLTIMGLSQFFSGIIIAFTISWKLTLVMLGCIPFIAMSAIFMVVSLKSGITDSRKAYEKAGGIAEEVLYNIKTVASFCNFDFEIERYNKKIKECEKIGIINSLKLGIGMGVLYVFLFCTYCIAIIYGSHLIVDKDWNSNYGRVFLAGDIITILFTCVMAASSLGQVSPNIKSISEACVAASDFFQLRDRKPLIDYSTSNLEPEKAKLTGLIEFKNVSFAYPSKPSLKILKNINLTFEPGRKIALVGKSGSGKSTIVNLIERLYDYNEGTVTLDGINIKDFDIKYLRNLIGYVQQEPVLFNRSIKDNIIFGREGLFKNQIEMNTAIQEACEDSYANIFIDAIDGKLDYLVGIKGSKLSGGQKQRIAIARAILTRPKILLLDEATSALDNKSEKEVQIALDKISQKNVTTIIVAHRLSTIMNADKIIVINEGQIIGVGTHEDLLLTNKYYSDIVKSATDLGENTDKAKLETDKNVKVNYNISNTARSNINNDETVPIINQVSKAQDEKLVAYEIDRTKLLNLLRDQKCTIALASLGSAINGAVFPIYGFALSVAIDVLSNKSDAAVLNDGLFLGLMFLVIAISAGFANYLQNHKFGEIGEILTAKLRGLVFEKYLNIHLGFFDKLENSPGSLLTKLSLDTTLLNGIVLTVVGGMVQTLVGVILGISIAFAYDWRLSLIALGFFPFMIISGYFTQKLRQGFNSDDDNINIEAGGILSECVINTKTIFSYNFENRAVQMYLEILSESKKTFLKESMLASVLFGFGQFANFAAFATLFYAGGQFMIKEALPFGNLITSIMTILFAAFGAGMAQQHAGDFAKARNAFNSLFTVINTESKIDTSFEFNKKKLSAENIKGKIEFKNVSFAYPTRLNNKVLKNISFTINPGQSVAFVGPSGNGKSTIIQLIERFYDVEDGDGEILIDNVNIKEYNLLELRKKIGLVMQEPCLFKCSIEENIRYGNINATYEEIKSAAEKTNIQQFFTLKDKGTKNSPFSGGEKQRIAIARTLLKNPTIMLLDEATSALDKKNESEVQNSLDILLKDKTSITIAHRLSTIEKSDVIYVLDQGKIIEKGTHKELYDLKGNYFNLYNCSSI